MARPIKKPDNPSRWLFSLSVLSKDAAKPLEFIDERNPIMLSEPSMAERLDPDNIEDPEITIQALLNELSEESDHITGEVKFCPVYLEFGNIRKQG